MVREGSSFDIPWYNYFTSKNTFIGSLGNFRYRLAPKEDRLEASVWHGKLRYDLSEMAAVEEFSLDQEGLDQALAWLEEQLAHDRQGRSR